MSAQTLRTLLVCAVNLCCQMSGLRLLCMYVYVGACVRVHVCVAHTGIEYREVKMIYIWSQMIVTDELKRRKRATSLMFFDFVEALARLADLLRCVVYNHACACVRVLLSQLSYLASSPSLLYVHGYQQ